VAVNPTDPRRRPFVPTVVGEACRRGMGVVGMKALGAGLLVQEAGAPELLRYAASPTDTVIVGCSTIDEVKENLAVARAFEPLSVEEQHALERRLAPRAHHYDYYKRR